ncbi:hypothetical protein VTJ49DRAFT_7520 [Mycothermus thermophilus]|uniref:beta-ketoacyl-[acyl-carrier-protein] synthase I n=1 Tax=Humicola insolens TaxID=85995 RepID=A0ABR3VPH2_HUMIN
MRRVVVTGLGAITPLGVGVHRTWRRLLAGESGIVSVADRGNDPAEQAQWRSLTSTVAGIVPAAAAPSARGPPSQRSADNGLWHAADWLDPVDQRRMSTFAQYAVAAAKMALHDAGWEPSRPEDQEMTGGYKKVSPLFVPKILINLAAGYIAMRHGLRGPNHAATTACTTGAHSIGDAARFIAFGDADVMVAGGAESCLHPLTFAGFGRSRSLSTAFNDDPPASCRPFDADRDGFVVAEGAAVMVLEELEHARNRGARVLAELRGYGCSGDAHHPTAPREDGSGALSAMRKALRQARLRPRDVDYINAHATGTVVGDKAEAAAIRTLMLGEDGVDEESRVTVSSTKGAIGHLLGAAGAIEAMFAVLAISENTIPPTLNLHKPDVRARFNFVPHEAQEKKVRVAISNSFGFGGTNASLRTFSTTSSRLGLKDKLFGRVSQSLRANQSSYYVYSATEHVYKYCASQADYAIDEKLRKDDTLQTTAEGEEIGTSMNSVWHQQLGLLPTFSTWAHVTMLHMYLLAARYRCFEPEAQQAWQAGLVNHFFYQAEAKMEVAHALTSRALRQRYLKDLFVQWRGVILAYDEGVVKGDAVLAEAVWRNLFKAKEDVDVRKLAAVVGWMRASLKNLAEMDDEAVQVDPRYAFPKLREQFAVVDVPAAVLKGEFKKAGVLYKLYGA